MNQKLAEDPTTASELPKGIKHLHKPEVDVIAWSNQRVKLNLINLVALSIGGGVVMIALLLFSQHLFFTPWYEGKSWGEILFTALFYLIPYLLLAALLFGLANLKWMESISISDDTITIRRSGLGAPKPKQLMQRNIFKIYYGRNVGDSDGTSVNCRFVVFFGDILKDAGGVKLLDLGQWLVDDDLWQVYQLVKQICHERGWRIRFEEDRI